MTNSIRDSSSARAADSAGNPVPAASRQAVLKTQPAGREDTLRQEYDLLRELRSGDSVPQICEKIHSLVRQAILEKPMEHCFEKTGRITEHRNMSEIGG